MPLVTIPLRLFGKSLKEYNFSVFTLPATFKPVEEFGMLYVYFYKDDKDIIEASNYIGVIYYADYEQLKADEVDILEGNNFEKNIQHNC